MKEEPEERKEQSKERTRKNKKKERGRVEDKCQSKEEEKSRKAEQGSWMLMGDGKGNSWGGGRPRMPGDERGGRKGEGEEEG